MTQMLDRLADRPAIQRVTIALLLAVAGLFCAGLAMGVIAAMFDHGHLPKRLWVLAVPLVSAPLAYVLLRAGWRLAVPPQSATPYERRYWRMWLVIVLLGVPVGALLGIGASMQDVKPYNLFTTAPLPAAFAGVTATLLAIVFTVAMVLYHRAIDDHEERAYLWASQVAYYFLLIALPVWWLLQRGGLVGPLTIGGALIAALISALIHGAVWTWLKFR